MSSDRIAALRAQANALPRDAGARVQANEWIGRAERAERELLRSLAEAERVLTHVEPPVAGRIRI